MSCNTNNNSLNLGQTIRTTYISIHLIGGRTIACCYLNLDLNAVEIKHGRIPVKVCSQHVNADNCGYSHIRKSENTDFYQHLQMFEDISQKFKDI